MRTLAHIAISAVSALALLVLVYLGMGGVDAIVYAATALDHDLEVFLGIAGALTLIAPVFAAVGGFWLIFHRFHYGHWLPRKNHSQLEKKRAPN